ncbi:MAG: hypothetical protein ACK5D5_01660 [Bacteroidota bacterium]
MKKFILKIFSLFTLIVFLVSATPKYYLHSFSDHNHSLKKEVCHHEKNEIVPEKKECAFEKLDTQLNYLSIQERIEFVSIDYLENINLSYKTPQQDNIFTATQLVRGPPQI